MGWTDPKTWSGFEALTAAKMNIYMRDNQIFLFDRPSSVVVGNVGVDYTTVGAAFATVDATNLQLSLTPSNSHVDVVFNAKVGLTNINSHVSFRLLLNSVTPFPAASFSSGIGGFRAPAANSLLLVSFSLLLTAGVDFTVDAPLTIDLQWFVSGGTATMYNGAGVGFNDSAVQFWAHEF